MKNNPRLILMAFSLVLSIACSEKKNDVKTNAPLKEISANLTDSEKSFQLWLKDTLMQLKSCQTEVGDFVDKKVVLVSEDSMNLSIKVYYNYKYYSKTKYPKEVFKTLELLKEYGEFPNNNDSISYVYYWEFYPSPIKAQSYELLFEIKDLIKKTQIKDEKFDYIRGRISNKEEYDKKGNLILSIDYLWEDNELKKVERKTN